MENHSWNIFVGRAWKEVYITSAYVRVNTNLTPVLGYLLPREDKIFNRDYAPSYSVPECRDWMQL